MNMIIFFTAVIQLARESIGLAQAAQSLYKKISVHIDKRKKH